MAEFPNYKEMGERILKNMEIAVKENTYMTLVECVEKQIPKERHHTRIDNVNGQIRVSVCPNCLGLIYTHSEEYPNYCSNCGQRIKWEV